jgi:hypothetical protein
MGAAESADPRSLSHVESNSLTRHNSGTLLGIDLSERLSF